jgi:hypothetical protein
MKPSPVDNPFAAYRLNAALELRADWDVVSFGREASEALAKEINDVRAHPAPHGARKIFVLAGPSGYGKTHVFGRVLDAQQERVQFVYVPMTSDPGRVAPVDRVRWEVVETLFHPVEGKVPLGRHLSRLLTPSVLAYFHQLDGEWKVKCQPICQRIESDSAAVLELFGSNTDLAPFHALADSIRKRFPNLSAGVLRALVLGLSRASDDARTWLRGERDVLPEERLNELFLAEASPDATAVLRVVANLLQQLQTPLLICLDQIEWLMQKDQVAFRDLTAALMAWLQEVPNLVLILGCMSDDWARVPGTFAAFKDRTKEWKLYQLSAEQAAELVVRRMRSWVDFPPGEVDGWPFDLASVKQHAGKSPISPRSLIQVCEAKFDKWLAEGKKRLIELGPNDENGQSQAEAFLKEWSIRLEGAKQSVKAAVNYQEADLWEGMQMALDIAQLGRLAPEGIHIEKVTPQALKKTAPDPRPSANIDLLAGEQRFAVVLAVSKKDSGQAFGNWVKALDEALGDPVVGAVAVWPKAELTIGKKTDSYRKYRELVNARMVRHFPLDENEETFRQVETLRQLLKDAETGDLNLNGIPVPVQECRRMLVETKVLARLKLFEMLFSNWPAIEVVRSTSSAPTTPPPSPPPSKVQLAAPSLSAATPALARQTATTPSPVSAPFTIPQEKSAPIDGETWAKQMLDLVVQKLCGKGQSVAADGFDLGPTFVRLKVKPKDDADFAKIKKQTDNLKLHLALEHKPIIVNQAGYISIDIQRPDRQFVPLAPLLDARPVKLDRQPAFPAGVDVMGKAHWLNLAEPDTCHVLVAGTTGSGKSEFLKVILAGLAHRLGPDDVTFFLIDPKQVTFNLPGGSPYLPRPIVHDSADALPVLEECHEEMERRYGLLRQRGKDHIGELTGKDSVPRWVVVFDEFADLMFDRGHKKTMEALLSRLGAKARASGIHLVLATQRPEASVVTPLLRSNLPGRLSLRVISEKDSKIILPEQPDAAHLLGRGDLLWWHGGGLVRLQSPFVTKDELETLLRFH